MVPVSTDHQLSTALLSGLEREVFDGSQLGVVERDLNNQVRYANRAALDMMGADHYEGLNLSAVFADQEAQKVLAAQTEERRKRLLGNYRVALTRLDNPSRKFEVEITGVPVLDRQGVVVGALGLFRSLEQQRLTDDIRKLTLLSSGRDELLGQVAEMVRTVIPFDLLLVSRLNVDDRETEVYYCYPPFEQDIPTVWFALNEEQAQYMEKHPGGINDFEQVMSEPPWNLMDHEPMVQQMRRMNLKSSMWRRVLREEQNSKRVVASITLLRRKEQTVFNADEEKLFGELPLLEAVLRSLDNDQRNRESRRLQLFRDLNRCTSADKACGLLAKALVEMFDWSHVCLFRVDGGFDRIRLMEQARKGSVGVTFDERCLSEGYQQPITAGVLGRVVATRQAENIGDVTKEGSYIQGPSSNSVRSELVVPILFEDESRVRFVINVDDPRIDAFSREHEVQLSEIAKEVAGAMQRITQVAFLTECFDNASDPIIATDAKLRIRRVNPAAAELFGYATPEAVTGRITDYFEATAPFEALATSRKEKLGELTVKRRLADGPPPQAYVTRKDFPDTLGGHVFIARDLRDIHRAVRLEFLEQTAYEIAVETKAPLELATAYLERLMKGSETPKASELQKVLRQLGRVKRSYTRLAMYNRSARMGAFAVTVVDLSTELSALIAALVDSDRAKIALQDDCDSAQIEADHTHVAIVLETLLSVLLRAAPEDHNVRVHLALEGNEVVMRMCGKLPAPRLTASPLAGWESARTDLRRADPLLRSLMRQQGGSLDVVDLDGDGETVFLLHFPRRLS